MDYQPILSPRAAEQLELFPAAVQDAVLVRLQDLCASPSKYSRPAVFPYHPDCQVSIVQGAIGSGRTFVVSIHFRFGQDEQTIEIGDFGHYILSGDEDEPPS